jgi:hypothetical protein
MRFDIPWFRIHRIAEDLGGRVSHHTVTDRTHISHRIVIEYGHRQKESTNESQP